MVSSLTEASSPDFPRTEVKVSNIPEGNAPSLAGCAVSLGPHLLGTIWHWVVFMFLVCVLAVQVFSLRVRALYLALVAS